MAAIKGKDGVISIGVSGSEVDVAQVKSYSITESTETAETTVMGMDSKAHVPTLLSWEGSMDVVYDTALHDFNSANGANFRAGGTAHMVLYPAGDDPSATSNYNGDIIVTSLEVTGETADVVNATINFTGTGDLTRTAI
jgi:hypothetical protein